MAGTEHDLRTRGEVSADISSAVVRLMSEYTGRGPTRARTLVNDEHVTVVLHDTLTKGERSLVRDGQRELVLTNRKAFQKCMGPDLIAAVERITGQQVIAFLSDNHIDPDIAVESFVLRPVINTTTDQNFGERLRGFEDDR
jgi:uncharacterized protein YbcI